ncbi:MAG: sulfite oxidase [Thermoanaerobaculia bacterium]
MAESSEHGKSPRILVRQESPFNAGPPPEELRASFVTPNDLFFVRSHGGVPAVDPADFRLEIRGMVEHPLTLSLADLARYPRHEVTATIQCAGNRRSELAALRPIPHELAWGSEAVSNARWAGIRLADLLQDAAPTADARHAAFCGLDEAERHGKRFHFGGSIPLEKALAGEVLLALEMNGEPLPPVHGYPLRVVVPGWIGARSVKWLHKIKLQAGPSDNYFQSVAYRLFPASVGPDNVVWDEGTMLGEQAINAVVTSPPPGAHLAAGSVHVEGFALAGGGRAVERVEISLDGGRSWRLAALRSEQERWAWRFWECDVDLASGAHEIVVRAWDSASQTQPEAVDQVWNFKGYMNNAWPRVPVVVREP